MGAWLRLLLVLMPLGGSSQSTSGSCQLRAS